MVCSVGSLSRGAFPVGRGAAGSGRGREAGAFAQGSRKDACVASSAGRQNAC